MTGIDVWAVVIAAVGGWLLGAAWYGVFGRPWIEALGKTKAELVGPSGKPSPIPFIISFVALLIMAVVLAVFVGWTGPGLGQGIVVGGLAWLGFVITSMTVNHRFTSQKPALTAIDGGHWLLVLLFQGAVIGGFGA